MFKVTWRHMACTSMVEGTWSKGVRKMAKCSDFLDTLIKESLQVYEFVRPRVRRSRKMVKYWDLL